MTQDPAGRSHLDDLQRLFRPRSIALVGATERSIWSLAAFDNLHRFEFPGQIVPVNPKGGTIHGLPAATSCSAAGVPLDAALLMVPEAALEDTIGDLSQAGIAGAVILSSGFAELGEKGAERQRTIAAKAKAANIRLLGPNCLGFANFVDNTPIWTTPLRRPMQNPRLGLVSQSGAVASQLEQFAYQQRIALTHMISTGNEADITVSVAIDYLVHRSDAQAIAVFLETVRDPAAFIRAVEAANEAGKPVIVLKVGASVAAARAAQAHTGSLVGDDGVFNALCRDLGITRVGSLEELVVTADLFARLGRIEPPGLALTSMSGGLCEIAIDQAEAEGIEMPVLAAETLATLRQDLPPLVTPNNPLDVTGAAMLQPELITKSLATVAGDPKVGLLAFVFDTPTNAKKGGMAANFIRAVGEGFVAGGKPALMFSNAFIPVNADAEGITNDCGVVYSGGGLRHVMTAIGHLFRWSARTPRGASAGERALSTARPLTERAVLDHLAGHGVDIIPGLLATSADEAATMAGQFSEPVVLKVASPDIQHKTEVGGILLKLSDAEAVRAGYETIVTRVAKAREDAQIDGVIVSPMRTGGLELFAGTMRDPQWGPVMVVGLGGVFVEVLKDVSMRLLPVTEQDVLEMLDELRGKALLDGFRGSEPVDRMMVARAVVGIGEAALALGGELVSLEVNPLLASSGRVEALDALAVWDDVHVHA